MMQEERMFHEEIRQKVENVAEQQYFTRGSELFPRTCNKAITLINYSSFQIGHPRSLFHLFLSFQTTTNVQKHFYLVSSGGIQTHDLSVASHKHEVPTRPDIHVLFLVLQWLF